MNVGAIGLVAAGGLLIHAALTNQSPLTDLQGIFQTGKVTTVSGSSNAVPAAGAAAATANDTGSTGATGSGPDPLTYGGHYTPGQSALANGTFH